MLQKLTAPYRGLSVEIWILALITLVNRAGAMVIPFLSLYLNKHLHFSLDRIGWIMSAFGLGSALGTFVGGKLTNRLGYLKVMINSLIAAGLSFFILQNFTSYYSILVGIFLLTFIADTYRPAIWVAMDAYSTPKNRTRSVTLIRLAINLGFAVGPAMGGLIIAQLGYPYLFWIDGATTLLAAFLLWKMIVQKQQSIDSEPIDKKPENTQNPYTDIPYLLFFLSIMFMGVAFMQFNSTMPIFFNKIIGLSEQQIGLLIAMNGFLIFVFEMPMVHHLEKLKQHPLKITLIGGLLMVATFITLNLGHAAIYPVLAMILLTFGEMISFPFSNTFALHRSNKGKKGDYMALYTLTFSFAHVIGPNLGMHLSDRFGFALTWYVMALVMILSGILMWLVIKILHNSRSKYFDTSTTTLPS